LYVKFFEGGRFDTLIVAMWSPTEPSTAENAPRNVQWQFNTDAAPQNVKVARHNALRFLRFQAPWADGRTFFALLRSAPADNAPLFIIG